MPSHFAKMLLVIVTRQTRVPDLDVAQQPFLGHQEQTVAIDIDPATLEHDALAVVPSRPAPRGEVR